MKTLALFVIVAGFLCFSPSASGELSVQDLEKISKIVHDSEARLEKRFSDEIQTQGKHFSYAIELQGKRITDLRERIDFQGHLIIALIIAIIAFVSVPMGIIIYQYNKNRDQQEREIEALRQRIEELETQRIIQA